jgi:DNA-binding beta-propeller fold protein YncE
MHDMRAIEDPFDLPAGMNLGGVSGVAINSACHIFLLHRGAGPLVEFDPDGRFVRAFGDGLFDRPHGLHIDANDNIWTTDLGGHTVFKFDPGGRLRMVLGVRGRPGEWHDYGHLRLFDEPNDLAVARNGDVFVLQGHGKATSLALKFDAQGNFIKTFGSQGKGPGEFDLCHSVEIDADGLLRIADRNNGRIQVFDQDGRYIRETAHPGTPCGLAFGPDGLLYLAHGHCGQVMTLDPRDGRVLGSTGAQGKGPNQYGEAHYIAVSARGEVFVTDTLNWRVIKYVRG